MLVPSANTPTPPLMLVVYVASIALVLLYSTSVGDTVVRNVLPLQQMQPSMSRSFMTSMRSGVSDGQTSAATSHAGKEGSQGNNQHHNMDSNNRWEDNDMESSNHVSSRRQKQEEEARRFLWRQRIRAVRHADYMRIETLHFLKLLSASIPRLRLVWRGEDYCSWEGVTCTALRYPLETLVDVPKVLSKHQKGNGSSAAGGAGSAGIDGMLTKGKDGARLLGDGDDNPVFTLVGVRLRGMNLFGTLPTPRPVGASQYASPIQSSAITTASMNSQFGRARREDRQRLAITSPRESHYWPWEPAEMRMYTMRQNGTYEMVRHTVSRILRRLEACGERANHSDLHGFASIAEYAKTAADGNGSGSNNNNNNNPPFSSLPTSSPSVQQVASGAVGIGRVLQDAVLPQMTHQDIAQTVFGEIEPRLVGIQRFDISHNPGLVAARSLNWAFPYMRTFDTVGTTPLPDIHNKNGK